jgi:3-deoxy-7-phosphoheptulonate synthase
VAAQIAAGDRCIIGTMIESHLVEGRQDIGPREQMTYGQGVTDACIGWDDTLDILQAPTALPGVAAGPREAPTPGHWH